MARSLAETDSTHTYSQRIAQTTGQLVDRSIHKCITNTNNKLFSGHPLPPNGKYFGCNEWFARKDLLDTHLRLHISMQEAITFDHTFDANYGKSKDPNAGQNQQNYSFGRQIDLQKHLAHNNTCAGGGTGGSHLVYSAGTHE
ncbi:unnamed protein product [Medioppia subpectinata]|uniref:C2H2-type domain-containing protein n=1 Tax=Medioppia subpectinata TaxID=1979941 RepID=A0A7R9LKK3_9ACAR|nr:unnamed protein product [Medioppia subpectinata]CAG2119631.1 unnamed protein product [Medioppia subpectinata]